MRVRWSWIAAIALGVLVGLYIPSCGQNNRPDDPNAVDDLAQMVRRPFQPAHAWILRVDLGPYFRLLCGRTELTDIAQRGLGVAFVLDRIVAFAEGEIARGKISTLLG